MFAVYTFFALAWLFLLGLSILWVVMPGGVEPGTPGRLMWENLFPWIQTEWYQKRRQLRQWRRLSLREQNLIRELDPKAVPPSERISADSHDPGPLCIRPGWPY